MYNIREITVETENKNKMLKTPRLEDHMMIDIMKKYNVKFKNLINLKKIENISDYPKVKTDKLSRFKKSHLHIPSIHQETQMTDDKGK